MKNTIIVVLGAIIAALVIFMVMQGSFDTFTANNEKSKTDTKSQTTTTTDMTDDKMTDDQMDETEELPTETKIGTSVEGNDIMAYHYGTGEKELVLVGGVHGAYAGNTTLLMNEMRTYFAADGRLPADIRLTIIPALNPDGIEAVYGSPELSESVTLKENNATVAGRFNANKVDLNRNFDCDWKATGVWRNQTVSGGSSAFSEPESQAIRDYVMAHKPAAVVVWFSAEGKVYPSACSGAPSTVSTKLASTFAEAADYPVESSFDAYVVNGDMVNWLAKENIPAISVLLTDYETTELSQNLDGVKAVISTYLE
ncbi:hypothetical protein KC722_00225 [Candidatus Kaiserbacteria bacterium]|nr:hypothetical protein [Candidatus Kaiserbacteria bacterium]